MSRQARTEFPPFFHSVAKRRPPAVPSRIPLFRSACRISRNPPDPSPAQARTIRGSIPVPNIRRRFRLWPSPAWIRTYGTSSGTGMPVSWHRLRSERSFRPSEFHSDAVHRYLSGALRVPQGPEDPTEPPYPTVHAGYRAPRRRAHSPHGVVARFRIADTKRPSPSRADTRWKCTTHRNPDPSGPHSPLYEKSGWLHGKRRIPSVPVPVWKEAEKTARKVI